MILSNMVWIGISIWAFVLVLSIIIEMNTSQLVSIWFGAGALAALILSAFEVDVWIQLLVFAVGSFVLILVTRPLAKKLNRSKETETTAAESLIGQTALVTIAIPADGVGEVKAKFEKYSAMSNEEINEGEKVKILNIEGNKLIVEKEKEEKQ